MVIKFKPLPKGDTMNEKMKKLKEEFEKKKMEVAIFSVVTKAIERVIEKGEVEKLFPFMQKSEIAKVEKILSGKKKKKDEGKDGESE